MKTENNRRRTRHTCRGCGQHRAIAPTRRGWSCRPGVELCPRCYQASCDRLHADLLKEQDRMETALPKAA